MCNGRLSEFARICGGELRGEDATFTGLTTDTRKLSANDLFVALSGPNYDGYDFLDQAQSLGACGFVVNRAAPEHLPHVVVDDTRAALGQFATNWRQRFNIPVAAITGSNGKTGTKEMLAAILAVEHETLATGGNLNNDIGVPLTLLRLKRKHQAAVIELGANNPGEIAYLAGLTVPDVGVITNASASHLEGFGDLIGVAREKGALLAALGDTGTAIINADDAFSAYWQDLTNAGTVFTFGRHADADFHVFDITQSVSGATALLMFQLATPAGECAIELPVAGEHNAVNAAAAAAAAYAMGCSLDVIRTGLAKANSVAGRMQIRTAACGARVIDDSYNSNPASARAAISFLADQKEPGWVVLGDMGELGSNAPDMHASIGRFAKEMGIRRLYAVGKLSRAAVAAFGDGALWFESAAELQDKLVADLTTGVNVLVKASRAMQLDAVAKALSGPVSASGARADTC
ncbi:MAG: UDP-N-acetylmuramoyl-tripeptide--D-alanyl-D-alanine ligase [Gammaproteobacteria bacterium]|nr:UDP-N-acetylmuramoyl-tripeptide--D-alanyl-D-alanine ligase [Gammaproteobacteria bacterium]